MKTNIPESIPRRKGARTTSGVPPEVKELLDAGELETVNLCEWLAVDHGRLGGRILRDLGWADAEGELGAALAAMAKASAVKRSSVVAGAIAGRAGKAGWSRAFEHLGSHRSDIARGWACELIGRLEECALAERLRLVKPLAADPNMGVRESAWLAVRAALAAELPAAIELLVPWTAEADPNLRRFASEATRPRGVWCRHIEALKRDPSLGLPILEPLKADSSLYVRNSVANWLNDASKSQPEWVRRLVARWLVASPTEETGHIAKRALRTLERGKA